jgi:ornithine carbamoyltransferase
MIRHVLTPADFSTSELRQVLRLAGTCKRRRAFGRGALAGRTVALVFQKPSMRTRVAFEVAALRLGGSVVSLGRDDVQAGAREPIQDVARVLSRYVDGIVVRTFAHRDAETFARHARCPVINGLSDFAHPCQALADLFTIQERVGRLKGVTVGYVGDGNNVLHSLLEGCARLGVHVSVATPRAYRPDERVWRAAQVEAARSGARVRWTPDPREAARGADVLYTDVWVSMGQERERAKRLKIFRPYQLNRALLERAKPGCRILHCLPAHRGEEITEELLEHSRSLVWDQAENRLHVQKALLLWLLGARR